MTLCEVLAGGTFDPVNDQHTPLSIRILFFRSRLNFSFFSADFRVRILYFENIVRLRIYNDTSYSLFHVFCVVYLIYVYMYRLLGLIEVFIILLASFFFFFRSEKESLTAFTSFQHKIVFFSKFQPRV